MPNHRLNNKFAQFRHCVAGLFATLFITLFALVASSSSAFAAENEVKLSTSTTDLTPGQEVTVSVELPENLPIYALTATLQYDQNIFEPIATADFTVPETTYLSYNAENQEFGLVTQSGAVDQNLFTLQLRVKDDPGVGDTNIALTNIASADGSEQTKYSPAIATVNVTKDAAAGAVVPVNEPNEIAEAPAGLISVFTSTPFIIAGIAILVVLVVAIFAYYYFYYRRADEKHRSRRPIYIILGAGAAVLVLLALFVNLNQSKKDVNHDGETGYDDAVAIVDYLINATGSRDADAEGTDGSTGSAGYYLASSTGSAANSGSSSPRPGDFDTNNDGHVDIGDAGHNAEQAQKETKVELKNSDQQLAYVEKGAHTLTFEANVEPADVSIHSIKIKDLEGEHNVDCVSNICTVEIPAQESAGKQEFTITDVITSNNKTFHPNLTINFEVLKDIPSVANVDQSEKEGKVTFRLVDLDHALTSGKATIYDHSMQNNLVEINDLKKNDTNVLTYEGFNDNEQYKLNVEGDYCRTEAQDSDYCVKNQTFFSHNFLMLKDFMFELKDFYVTDYVDAGNRPTMTFVSSNNANSPVYQATVKIDEGEEHTYEVAKADGENRYEVLLDKATIDPGTHHVSLESVTIDALKTFTNPEHYKADKMPYLVPESIPEVDSFLLNNESDLRHVHASFKVKNNPCTAYESTNPICTLSKLTLVMTDSSGNVVATHSFNIDEIRRALASSDGTLSANLSYLTDKEKNLARSDRKFKVELLADYDLGGKHNYSDKKLTEDHISAFDASGLTINELYGESYDPETNKFTKTQYVTKDQDIYRLVYQPTYKDDYLVPSNGSKNCGQKYNDQPTATINGLNYTVYNPFSGNNEKPNYRAALLTLPHEAGVVELKLSRLQYMINGYYCKVNDWYPIQDATHYVEVLRDKPYIANFKVKNKDYENKKMTFVFDVVVDPSAVNADNSLTNATFTLTELQNKKSVHSGHNELTFDANPAEPQSIWINGDYDLDSDALNKYNGGHNENFYGNQDLLQTFYGVLQDNDYADVAITEQNVLSASSDYTNSYFEKNEEVKLNFKLEGLPAMLEMLNIKPSRATVKDQEYDLIDNGNGYYSIVLPGFPSAGPESYTITSIVLDNGEEVPLSKSADFTFEVLKDAPTVKDFSYKEGNGNVIVNFNISDPDDAIVGDLFAEATNATEASKNHSETISPKTSELSFTKYGDLYYFDITADYSRLKDPTAAEKASSDDHRYFFKTVTLLEASLSFTNNLVQLKDISDISLYHTLKNGSVELVDVTDEQTVNSDLSNYFVEVAMQSMPTMRAKVKSVKTADIDGKKHLIIVVEENCTTTYDASNGEELELDFGEIRDNNKAKNEFHPAIAFQNLINKLSKGESVVLDRDYDASALATDNSAAYVDNFTSGELDGNGHTIKNLQKPLFNKVSSAEIKNLTLANVTLTGSEQHGALANTVNQSTISQVTVTNFRHNAANGSTGSMVGIIDNSTIEQSKSVNFAIGASGYSQVIGGLIGKATNTHIQDNYATGTLNANWNHTAGFVGSNGSNNTVEHNYSKVKYNNTSASPIETSCGFTCLNSSKLSGNISLNLISGNIGRPFANLTEDSSKNYYLKNDNFSIPQDQENRVTTITPDQVDSTLFEEAGFNKEIWQLDDQISYDTLPRFTYEKDVPVAIETDQRYQSTNNIAYNNMQKLMPFFEYQKIVESGNALNNEALKTRPIKHLLPLDNQGNLVTYLTTDDPKRIATLRIVFEDGEKQDYGVIYENSYDMVANYYIRDLGLDYNFPHYVIDNSTRIVDNLVGYLSNLNYATNLDTLTSGEDSRVYRDFYNETTKHELREFVLKYLSNSNLTSTLNNRGVSAQIERQVKADRRLEKTLYVYNYLRRFYDLSFDNLKLYDIAMFNMQGFNSDYTTDAIVNKFMSDPANFNTSTTEKTFINVYGNYCGMDSVSKFIETSATQLATVKDMEQWTRDQFKGYLVEIPVDGHKDDVQYTLWDHFSNWDTIYGGYGDGNKIRNQILPILTLPANSAYIFSMPAEFAIGDQRTYIANPDDPNQRKLLEARAEPYRDRLQNYFNTTYALIQDPKIFNDIHVYHTDSRLAKDVSGNRVYNTAGSADPFVKNYNEVLGRWSASDGNAAVAWGDRIDWSAESFLDSVFDPEAATKLNFNTRNMTSNTWDTFTHESAHNIDARLFLKNNGKRFDTGGEDYADSFLMQNFDPNGVNMNLSISDLRDAIEGGFENKNYGSNYSYEAINSDNNIKRYYKNLFDAIYVMDYIEAQAFLELTPEEQAVIGAQVSYPDATGTLEEALPNEGKAANLTDPKIASDAYDAAENKTISPYRAYRNTRYSKLDATKFEELNLQSVDELYDNRIMVVPGLYYGYTTRGDNLYGGEGYNTVHWYQPHNNYGRPDSYSFKWLTFEMTGNGGYNGGFIEYGSNINSLSTKFEVYLDEMDKETVKTQKKPYSVSGYKSDAMALKKITDQDSFEDYKKGRFADVASKLNKVDSTVNVKQYATDLYDALKKDVEVFNNALAGTGKDIEACSKDNSCSRTLTNAMSLRNSTALRQKFLNDLKVKTEDFTKGPVFTDSDQQGLNDANEIRTLIQNHKKNAATTEPATIDLDEETEAATELQQNVKDLETDNDVDAVEELEMIEETNPEPDPNPESDPELESELELEPAAPAFDANF